MFKLSAWLMAMALSGCGGCGARTDGAAMSAEPRSAPGQPQAGPSNPSPGPGTPRPPGDGSPPPRLSLVGQATAAGVAAVLRNRDLKSVELAGNLGLEMERDQQWMPVATQLDLRWSCSEKAPPCLTLSPGAELHPPAWTSGLGPSQCDCKDCRPAPAGRYRFVVKACDGRYTVRSEGFQL